MGAVDDRRELELERLPVRVEDGVKQFVEAATIGGALAKLGPGRWSLDVRLFGWKRIEAPPRAPTPAH